MPLSSTSTDDEVQAAYDDNAGYAFAGGGGSVAMAVEFATACRIMIGRRPAMGSQDGQMASFPVYLLEAQLREATQFIAVNRSGRGGNRLIDLRDCRE